MISLFRNFYLKPVFPPPLLSSPRRRCRQCNDTLIPGLFPFLGSWNSQRLQIHERVQLKSESRKEKKIVKEIIPLIRYGSHTFKMVNEDNEAVYCKFHYKTDQGIKCFDRLVVVIVIIIVIVKMKLFP